MTIKDKREDFEKKLAHLKQELKNHKITLSEYTKEVNNLRFDDEETERVWLLEPKSEKWLVAPIGTEEFEEYIAESESTSDESISSGIEQPLLETPPSEPEALFQDTSSPASPASPLNWLVIGGGIAVICLILLLGSAIWLSWRGDQVSPSSTATVGVSTFTPTTVAQLSESPTFTPSPTFSPTLQPEPTSTPLPSATPFSLPTPPPSPTPTDVPYTATSTLSLVPTATPTTPATATPTKPLPKITDTAIPTGEPHFSGKLAYSEYDNTANTFNVQVIDLSSRQIIKTVTQGSQPALTSDGITLAYISWASDSVGLYSISLLEGGNRNTIGSSNYAQRPQWSFDGRAVVFEEIQGERKDIRFSDQDGVPGIQKGQTPTWTPQGRLVVQVCQGTSCGLATTNTDGVGLQFITANTTDISPSVSPDGQWVAYTSEQTGNWDVWLVPMTGGSPTCLTTSPHRDGIPTWSPDGQWIAFASETAEGWTVQVIHPDGTEQQKLLNISGNLDAELLREDYRQLGWLHESISWSK